MSNTVVVAGVGMIPFTKPGQSRSYAEMGAEATRLALADAGLSYQAVQQAMVGYVYGDSTSGQTALYSVGMSGIPVVNVNNNCSTGSTALYLARQLVEAGAAECVLALGFEQMQPGALVNQWHDRQSATHRFDALCDELHPYPEVPMALRFFGGAGLEYMQQHGVGPEIFAQVRAKASRHAEHNPMSIFRRVVSAEEVLASPMVFPQASLTRLMACPPTCGAAAAILVSDDFARRNKLDARVSIRAQVMTSDEPDTFDQRSMTRLIGTGIARRAADRLYELSGVDPLDIDVVELHDCFAQNEVLCYEALRLCPEGGASRFIAEGDNTYGGQVVTNPSGGLLSKGHPLGATGLAQCTELVQQLRGESGVRQVPGARLALQHNLGLGSACVVTLYQRQG